MSTAPPTAPSARTGRDRSERYRGVRAQDALINTERSFMEAERWSDFERYRTMFLSDMIYRGKHRVFMSRSGWWKEIPIKPGTPQLYYPENYYRVLADGNKTEMTRAQVEFDVRAVVDSDAAEAASRSESTVLNYYQRRYLTESFRDEVAIDAQNHGIVPIYGWWDETAGNLEEKPIYGTEMVKPAPDLFQCTDCGKSGSTDQLLPLSALSPPVQPEPTDPNSPMLGPGQAMPQQPVANPAPPPDVGADPQMGEPQLEPEPEPSVCPDCGSPNYQVSETPEVPRKTQIGATYEPTGDFALEQVPAYQISVNGSARTTRVSGKTRYKNLLRIKRTRQIDRAFAETLHPNKWDKFAPSGAGMYDSDTRHLQYEQRIERTHGGAENDRTGWTQGSSRLVEYTEVWLLPEAYSDYKATMEHQLWDDDGPLIEAGQTLLQLFPDGLKMCMSGKELLSVVPEDARRHWRFIKCRQLTGTFWGGDFADAIPMQLLLNEYNSQILSNSMKNEAPTSIVNSLLVKNIAMHGQPGQLMTYDRLPADVRVSDLYAQFPGQPMAAPAYGHPDNIRRAMQSLFGGSFEGAISGESSGGTMKTATAWNVAQSRATAKGQTLFALLAEGYAGVLEMALDLFRENAGTARRIELAGDYAESEAAYISGAMIGRDLEITVRQGSVVPRQDYQLRDDLSGAFETEGEYLKLHPTEREIPGAVARIISERWNTPIVASKAEKGARAARRVLKDLQQVVQRAPQLLPGIAEERMAEIASAPDPTPDPMVPDGTPVPDGNAMRQMAGAQLMMQMQDPQGQAMLLLEWIQKTPGAPGKFWEVGDYHWQMAEWYRDWMNTDAGYAADELTRYVIAGRRTQHLQADAMELAQSQVGPEMAAMQLMPPQEPDGDEKPKDDKGPNGDTKRERQSAGRSRPPANNSHLTA